MKNKILKKGYMGETMFDIKSNLIIKQYNYNSHVNYRKKISPMQLFENEINSVKNLSRIRNFYVQTPVIVSVYKKGLKWSQEYFKGIKFYRYLLINCNKLYFDTFLIKQFYGFGSYLGDFHNTFYIENINYQPISEIHGDLSSHNIMFLKNKKIFIYDPNLSKRSVYVDLSKFIINLRFINPTISIFLSKKYLISLEKAFLKGYEKELTKFKLDKKLLKKEILGQLEKERYYLSNKLSYKIKKYLMNLYNKRVYKKIQRELESE